MGGDINQRQAALTFTPEIYCFVAERRERCKPAEDTDEYQRARFSGEEAARLGELGKESDGETADKIYCQSAVGEMNAAANILYDAAYGVAQNRSKKTAKAC